MIEEDHTANGLKANLRHNPSTCTTLTMPHSVPPPRKGRNGNAPAADCRAPGGTPAADRWVPGGVRHQLHVVLRACLRAGPQKSRQWLRPPWGGASRLPCLPLYPVRRCTAALAAAHRRGAPGGATRERRVEHPPRCPGQGPVPLAGGRWPLRRLGRQLKRAGLLRAGRCQCLLQLLYQDLRLGWFLQCFNLRILQRQSLMLHQGGEHRQHLTVFLLRQEIDLEIEMIAAFCELILAALTHQDKG